MTNGSAPVQQLPAYKKRFSENGARALLGGGAVIKFLATSEDTNGLYAMFEAKGVPGMEPPAHTHTREDETYYMLDGKFLLKVGNEEFTATKGDFVFLPRNVKHEFKVLSESFHCQVAVFPAALDGYFMEISKPHHNLDIPPPVTEPPTPELMEQMAKLNEQFGIVQ